MLLLSAYISLSSKFKAFILEQAHLLQKVCLRVLCIVWFSFFLLTSVLFCLGAPWGEEP